MIEDKRSLFNRKLPSMLLAASTAVVWAFAFPLIKLGIAEFGIMPDDTGAKTLFAGVRFFLAGAVVLSAALCSEKGVCAIVRTDMLLALLLGFVNTALHYFCYYIGLSNQSGSRSAIIDSLSSFILILSACAVFRDEHLTFRKLLGCAVGFAGILTVNLGGGSSSGFTLSGDGMLILSAVFSAAGGLLTRVVTNRIKPAAATGISLAFGGLLMIAAGILMGGRLEFPSAFGVFILLCLTGISVYGFSIYNKLISCNPVGEIAIFNSLIPVLGVTFSCIILHEPFKVQYVAAGLLAAAGIFIINYSGMDGDRKWKK